MRSEASSTKKRKAQTSDVNTSVPKRSKKKSSRSDAVQDPDVSVVLASFAAAAPPSQRLGASTSTTHSASAPSTSNLTPSPSPSCHSSPLPLPLSTGYIPPFPTSHSPTAPSTSDHLTTSLLPPSTCQTPFPLPTWHHSTSTSHWTPAHLTYSPIHDHSSHNPPTSLLRHTPSTSHLRHTPSTSHLRHTPSTSRLRHTPSTSSMTRPPFSTNITPYRGMLDIFPEDFHNPSPSMQQLEDLHHSLASFKTDVLKRLDRLECLIRESVRNPATPSTSARAPVADLNGRLYDVQATKITTVDDKLQQILMNPKISAPVQVGMVLAKVLFTEDEMASSTLTGRKTNGQSSKPLDPAKRCLLDNLAQQKCGLGEGEFSAVRSGIREPLANRCKYLRLKLGPRNISAFLITVYDTLVHRHCLFNIPCSLFYFPIFPVILCVSLFKTICKRLQDLVKSLVLQ